MTENFQILINKNLYIQKTLKHTKSLMQRKPHNGHIKVKFVKGKDKKKILKISNRRQDILAKEKWYSNSKNIGRR